MKKALTRAPEYILRPIRLEPCSVISVSEYGVKLLYATQNVPHNRPTCCFRQPATRQFSTMDRYAATISILLLLATGCASVTTHPHTVYKPMTGPDVIEVPVFAAHTNTSQHAVDSSATAHTKANAHVVDVLAIKSSGTWEFHVTVKHAEKGWSDYTDGWNVELPDGTVLLADPSDEFTRRMFHPHVRNRTLRRSQSGLAIPSEVDHVVVRAHDSKHGFGGKSIEVRLNQESGAGFKVVRK